MKGRVNYVDSFSKNESSYGQPEAKDTTSEIGKIMQTEVAKCMGNMMQQMSSNKSMVSDANMVQNTKTGTVGILC